MKSRENFQVVWIKTCLACLEKIWLPGKFETKPPLFSMVSLSFSIFGSWSIDSGLALPFLEITARESPTLATTNFLQLISMAVTAVEPPGPKSFVFSSRIVVSVMRYALLIAFSVSVQKSGYKKRKKDSIKDNYWYHHYNSYR